MFNLYSGARIALVTAAILLLVMPAPSAGGPCDCATCRSLNNQRARCECCVYHGVGGKRAAAVADVTPFSSDAVTRLLTALARARAGRILDSAEREEVSGGNWAGGEAAFSKLAGGRGVLGGAEFGFRLSQGVKGEGEKVVMEPAESADSFRRLLSQSGLDLNGVRGRYDS